ncbi:MAG: M20 aminoacylase family protein [Magnetospiraceae bacterium]
MNIIPEIARFTEQMVDWRHRIHAHPETAFEEVETAAFVAEKLRGFGLAVETGIAETGVVATLNAGGNGPAIGLRADMDALHIEEANTVDHKSRVPGKMHACGHDGHTTMLLGAAKYLSENPPASGLLHFIFQPAEENEGGAGRMVDEGLFTRFPMDAVYGLHNWPALELGKFAVRAGPMMAACDLFEITIEGRGAHAAMPHQGVDAIVVAAKVVDALQTLVSREISPLEPLVVSITQIHGGDTWNVLPQSVVLRGTSRAFSEAARNGVEPAIRRVVKGICEAHGARFDFWFDKRYPATINHAAEADTAAQAASAVVGADQVLRDLPPSMGSEDFSFMLQACPGAYIWMGTGIGPDTPGLHNPRFDFNDNALAMGASYWVELARRALGEGALTGPG